MRFDSVPSRVERYSPEQVATWKRGAANFREFWKGVNTEALDEQSEIPALFQALFLGEKPAMFDRGKELSQYAYGVGPFGFEVSGDYIYSPERVQGIIDQNAEVFASHNLRTPEQAIDFLNNAGLTEQAMMRGLILGYPKEAVQEFERTKNSKIDQMKVRLHELLEGEPEKQLFIERGFHSRKDGKRGAEILLFYMTELKRFQKELDVDDDEMSLLLGEVTEKVNKKRFGVNGLNWVDKPSSKESVDKEKKVQTAFKQSGFATELPKKKK